MTTTELYDLTTDPGKENNMGNQHPEMVKELLDLMAKARTPFEIFTFDSPTLIK